MFYNADGYVYFMNLNTDWYMAEDVVPNLREFELFITCSDIPLSVRQHTIAKMLARILQIGDEVKITHRDLRGLFGKIIDITEKEANICLTMQDVTTTIHFSVLQKYLKAGDEVCILEGDNQGVTQHTILKTAPQTSSPTVSTIHLCFCHLSYFIAFFI